MQVLTRYLQESVDNNEIRYSIQCGLKRRNEEKEKKKRETKKSKDKEKEE